MSDMLYVGLQDDDKVVVFALDGDGGKLTKRADVAAAGGPSREKHRTRTPGAFRGTDGSNPASSSGDSLANLTSSIRAPNSATGSLITEPRGPGKAGDYRPTKVDAGERLTLCVHSDFSAGAG
jgi:hypothetical protein